MFWDSLLLALEGFENIIWKAGLPEAELFLHVLHITIRERKLKEAIKKFQFAYMNAVRLSSEWNDLLAGWMTFHYRLPLPLPIDLMEQEKIAKEKSFGFMRKEMDTF